MPAPVVAVTPTAHLKTQWAQAAARLQLHFDPAWLAGSGKLDRSALPEPEADGERDRISPRTPIERDLQPGETKTRTESASPFKIMFRSKIGADGLRATAAATVWKGDQIVTRQSSDVSLER